jgi:hypothetical protein
MDKTRKEFQHYQMLRKALERVNLRQFDTKKMVFRTVEISILILSTRKMLFY